MNNLRDSGNKGAGDRVEREEELHIPCLIELKLHEINIYIYTTLSTTEHQKSGLLDTAHFANSMVQSRGKV